MSEAKNKETKTKTTQLKEFKGVVISEFNVGSKNNQVKYKIDDIFITKNYETIKYLIKNNKIKEINNG